MKAKSVVPLVSGAVFGALLAMAGFSWGSVWFWVLLVAYSIHGIVASEMGR